MTGASQAQPTFTKASQPKKKFENHLSLHLPTKCNDNSEMLDKRYSCNFWHLSGKNLADSAKFHKRSAKLAKLQMQIVNVFAISTADLRMYSKSCYYLKTIEKMNQKEYNFLQFKTWN